MSRATAISFDFKRDRIVGAYYPAPEPSGARVLLSHGFSGTRMGAARAFVDLAQGLSDAGCAVYAFDRLGHGESDGRFLDVTVPNEIEQLSAMIDYIEADGRGPIHLLGHSLGGMESACLAGQRPDAIASLTLWAPAAAFVDDIKNNQIQGQSLDRLYESGVFDFNGQALGSGFIESGKPFDPYAGLEAFVGKVWLHHGEADSVVPMKYAERYAAVWSKNATLYRYAKADHGWNQLADRTLLLQRTVSDIAGLVDRNSIRVRPADTTPDTIRPDAPSAPGPVPAE